MTSHNGTTSFLGVKLTRNAAGIRFWISGGIGAEASDVIIHHHQDRLWIEWRNKPLDEVSFP